MTRLPLDLSAAIVSSGYFPEFVAATVMQAVDGEDVIASLVHHEATFNAHELHRHITVLVLTPTRFIVAHTDDGDNPSQPQALTTTEAVALRRLKSVALTQVAANPERFGRGARTIAEAWLVVNWGAIRRVEIEPAGCNDPNCDADHGFTAQDLADDLTVRMSVAADGEDAVLNLITFASKLQRVAGL
ncbi:phosphodiesterase [Propioniciclava coleopterorum]|uniref:Phosphodiesterase n=1 Tax=Propioniciclava coleopterorum TaxID=2714937 RepID=A0A6G7Y953_9ACTN|nr:DUF5998 family protein [Propioniciclava coleopterorum]QIK73424.1 phosphodiesterase [Propioniciclava coleopterorum]